MNIKKYLILGVGIATGVGVSIADRIINKYNAKLDIQSILDEYTTITIYFEK